MTTSKTMSTRVITALGAASVALGIFAPAASAMTAEDVTAQVHSQVDAAVADAQNQALAYLGDGISTTVPLTTVEAHGHTVTAPVSAPAHIVDAANQIDGVNVTTGGFTAGVAPIAPETHRVQNNDLAAGTERTVAHGVEGIGWNVADHSGVVVESQDTVVEYAPPAPAPARVAAPAPYSAPVAAPSAPHGVWDSLAQCESGGNWSINTGNGYHGGLQFHPQTWIGHGGQKYAPYAYQATREQQIEVAKSVQASQGWGAWPACTSRLGIR